MYRGLRYLYSGMKRICFLAASVDLCRIEGEWTVIREYPVVCLLQASQSQKLEAKVAQMLEWNVRRSVITLSSDKFSTYVRSKPKNYSVIATFTALKPHRQCSICQ